MKRKELSPEEKARIEDFRKRKIGYLFIDRASRDHYYGIMYFDYKGEMCQKQDAKTYHYFKARSTKKGFVLLKPKEHVSILHNELLAKGVPSSKRKVIEKGRHTSIVRESVPNNKEHPYLCPGMSYEGVNGILPTVGLKLSRLQTDRSDIL